MDLLARREHSRGELQAKLGQRFPENLSDIASVLIQLEEERLLSDQRFVESFVHGRVKKGHGPLRIRMDLKRRGVVDDLIEASLSGFDWVQIAWQVRIKKFGAGPMLDYQQRVKAGRFLQYRGFSSEEISRCLEGVSDD